MLCYSRATNLGGGLRLNLVFLELGVGIFENRPEGIPGDGKGILADVAPFKSFFRLEKTVIEHPPVMSCGAVIEPVGRILVGLVFQFSVANSAGPFAKTV